MTPQEIAWGGYVLGLVSGVVFSTLMVVIAYRWGLIANVSQSAERIAEYARITAEIQVGERRLKAAQESLRQLFNATAPAASDRAVKQ
jgi:hypothetical protein